MIEILSPASTTTRLSRLLGETEFGVRAIVVGCAALALLAALAWAVLQFDVGIVGHPGSAAVLQALVGLMALAFAGVAGGLRVLGAVAAPMPIESLLA